ncbi:MAG: virulence RhuM family protein [Thermomicrobiales bacterium]
MANYPDFPDSSLVWHDLECMVVGEGLWWIDVWNVRGLVDSGAMMSESQFLVYEDASGTTRIDVRMVDESVWLTQQDLSVLFQASVKTINEHVLNIFEEGELDPAAVERTFQVQRVEGTRVVRRQILHYNLDMVISVGYRVRSRIATQFRIWATNQLRELIVKGFVLDDARLKAGRSLGQDYFDELLERIRDIRASEKRFYQKIRDIFALSSDYNKDDAIARQFFRSVQNKLLYAVIGNTAAEIIQARADHTQPNMGLTSWEGVRVRKADVDIAKNYLHQEEMDELNRIVVMYLDYAEDRAKRQIRMTMQDWSERLDAFLRFNERDVLEDFGRVSATVAKETAVAEYGRFDQARKRREAEQADEDDLNAIEAVIRDLDQGDASAR